MPDHIHFLCEGLFGSSDLITFLNAFKQRTAYEFRKKHGSRLWSSSSVRFTNHRLDEVQFFPDRLDASLESKNAGLKPGLYKTSAACQLPN